MDSPYLYYLGLDLGQARDYSALSIIEEQVFIAEAWANEVLYAQDLERGVSPGWVSPASVTPYQAGLTSATAAAAATISGDGVATIPEANPLSYNSGSALAILALWLLPAPFSTWP